MLRLHLILLGLLLLAAPVAAQDPPHAPAPDGAAAHGAPPTPAPRNQSAQPSAVDPSAKVTLTATELQSLLDATAAQCAARPAMEAIRRQLAPKSEHP